MPYTNERVTAADIEQFELKALSKRYAFATAGLRWTLNRSTGSYLLPIGYNPEDPSMKEFLFHWDGELRVMLLQVKAELTADQRYVMDWHWLGAPASPASPEDAQRHQARMAALKEALLVFKANGLSSPAELSYVISFDF